MDFAKLNHLRPNALRFSSFSFDGDRKGDHAKPLLGLSMLNTIGMVCLVRYAHDLAGAKEGRFCDLPITCTPTHIASGPYR
jgi:hypothetical protein